MSETSPSDHGRPATFVLVHGAWHGGWCWKKLTPLLREAGYDVFAPTLTGLGERSHLLTRDVGLDTHITDIGQVLEYEDLTNVVLVGHSYGGMVITGVADRAGDRIAQLVYLDAAHPINGEGLADVAPEMMQLARSVGEVVNGVEVVLQPFPESGRFYGVDDDDDLAWMQSK